MEMHQISYFIKVAQLLNFTRAAEELHVSQPSLSRQVKLLEEELGVLLLERLPQGLKLTPAGEVLLPHLCDVMRRLEQVRGLVQPYGAGQKGRVVIGAVPSVAARFLPGALAAFLERFPDAETSVHVVPTADELLRRIHEGEIDLGICGSEDEALSRAHLYSEPLVAAVPAALAEDLGATLAARELERLPFVSTPGTCEIRRLMERDWPAGLRRVVEVDNLTASVEMAGRGIGVAVVPASLVAGGAPAGVSLLPLDPPLQRTICAYWRREGFVTEQHPLVALLREQARGRG